MDEKRNALGESLGEFLAGYDPSVFDKPAVTADCLIFAGGGKQLLCVRRGNHPCIGEWALPGGFCERGESCDQTAARELFEETGHRHDRLRLLCFASTPNRDPRDWIMTAVFTDTVDSPFEVKGGDDAAEARWLDVTLTRDGDKARLTLTGENVHVYSDLEIKTTPVGTIDLNVTTVKNHGIAFDHAKIILSGLLSDRRA